MKRILLLLVLGAGAAIGWWVVSPRSAVEDLRSAAHAGDEAALNDRIEFDSVRAHLKTDLRTRFGREADGGDAAATLGAAIGGLLMDGVIDTFVSPLGLSLVLAGQLPEEDLRDGAPSREAPAYAIDRRGPNRFHVRFEDEGARPVLEFRRFGLEWRMVRIRIENDARTG